MCTAPARAASRLAIAACALVACSPRASPPPPASAPVAPAQPTIVLPDAGPDAVAAAEAAVRASVPAAPALRLDLIADLRADDLLGVAPGAPADALEKKLGRPEETQGESWRWPSLGIEAVVRDGLVQRLALHASRRAADPRMKIFVGEVLLGSAPLTQAAPRLQMREVVPALGAGGARGQTDGTITELAWRRGGATLFLTFDDDTLTLEAIVLERFNQALWDLMKPLESTPALWDLDPEVALAERAKSGIAFAQIPSGLTAAAVAKMRLVAGGEPDAARFFAGVESHFLPRGESLSKLDGRRAAMLRVGGCVYLVIESAGGTWEARNPDAPCSKEREPEGPPMLQRTFAPPASAGQRPHRR